MREEHRHTARVVAADLIKLIERTAPGSHVITPRRGFLHHGIYVGDGNVVHYAGFTHGIVNGPVEEISLHQFTCGRTVWTDYASPVSFCADEVVRRARSRVGENHYRLFSNNCEHFCEWCLRGEHRSYQVEALLSIPERGLEVIKRLIQRGSYKRC